MPKVNTFNYDTIASWNGSQDLFVVEQPDGTKVATPAMVKQFIEAGDFAATGEVEDGHGNILKDMAKSADVDAEIGDLSQTGITGDSVAEQLGAVTEVKTISGSGSYGCSYYAYKYGRIVMLKVRNVANATTGQGMDLFSLPQGWRPLVDTDVAGRYSYGDFNIAVGGAVNFRAEAAAGKVWTYSYKAFTSGNADFVYICDE